MIRKPMLIHWGGLNLPLIKSGIVKHVWMVYEYLVCFLFKDSDKHFTLSGSFVTSSTHQA